MFCIRPIPLEFESFTGYLYRLAIENHSSINVLCNVFNINLNHVNHNWFTNEILAGFSTLTGIDFVTAHEMMNGQILSTIGDEFSHHHILKNGVKYCPYCIQEKIHHNRLWFLNCYNVSHKHGILLVDRCDQCGGNIKMHSLFRGSCSSCGFLLLRSEKRTDEAPGFHAKLNQSLILNSPFLFDQHGPYTYNQFLKLAQYSFHLLDGQIDFTDSFGTTIQAFHKKKGRQQLNADMMISLTNVVWMYSDFPNNFYKVLDLFSKRKDRSAYVTKSTFEKIFDDPCYSKVHEVYENFWLQKLNKGEIRRDFSVFKKNADLLDKRTFIRKEEAKGQFSNEKIIELATMKKVKIVNTENARGYLVEGDSLRQFQRSMDEYVNKKEAAAILGISRDSIAKLVKSGLLSEYDVETSKIKLIKKTDLQNLLDTCRSHGNTSTNVRNMLSFNKTLITHSVNGLTMDKLIRSILNGDLRPIITKRDGGFSYFYFKNKDLDKVVERLKGDRRKKHGYFREEVMKILMVGEKKMKELHQRNILVPDEIVKLTDGRLRYLYGQTKVEQYIGRNMV